MYESANTNSPEHARKLSAEIKKTWGKLTDEEIGFRAGKPEKFYEAVKTKYSINKDEAEKTVKKLGDECAVASGTDKASDKTAHTSTPLPKAANA